MGFPLRKDAGVLLVGWLYQESVMDIVLAHICISLLPLFVLTIMYVDARKDIHFYFVQRYMLRLLILLVWCVIVIDNLCWYIDGNMGRHMKTYIWLANSLVFCLDCAISYVWFLHVDAKLHGGEELVYDRKRFTISLIPLVVYCFFLFATPWTGFLFTIDNGNHYQRGPYYCLPYLINLLYLLVSALLPLMERRHVRIFEQRRDYLYLSLFSALPIVGSVIQILNYELWTALPCSVFSLLLIYLMSQNQHFAEDALTGLFNRGELDRHLVAKCNPGHGYTWCFILMDIDDFKQINDLYGHSVGDEALHCAAGILKAVFGRCHAFLVRYGGDEFAVVLDCQSQDAVDAVILQLEDAVRKENEGKQHPYQLSISCGYAFYDAADGNVERLVKDADLMMYRNKQERKRLKREGRL